MGCPALLTWLILSKSIKPTAVSKKIKQQFSYAIFAVLKQSAAESLVDYGVAEFKLKSYETGYYDLKKNCN